MENIKELLSDYERKNIQNELDRPFAYIQKLPGKKIRSKLSFAFNYWLNIPANKLQSIDEIVQMLHNASLLIDDIEDDSSLRRGLPVAHSIYGVAMTINAANYAFFLALEKVQQLDHLDATKIYTEQMLELHRGQGMEVVSSVVGLTTTSYVLSVIR